MGTRCNVVINFGDTKVRIYRHWDGYLSMTGQDVFNKIKSATKRDYNSGKDAINIAQLVQSFLIDGNYRLDSEQAGDLQYIYEINFNDVYQNSEDYNKSNLKSLVLHSRNYGKWDTEVFYSVDYLSDFDKKISAAVKQAYIHAAA
jgi:hypothetical protein|tara:strand:+ start:217 stop:651 length:435 start_codon:yes stop_codon:yes gene_type:complete